MALVLSLREGQDFYVEDEQFVVSKIMSVSRFILSRKVVRRFSSRISLAEKQVFDITDGRSQEVSPGVFVSAGNGAQHMTAKVAIEAPRDVLILRGERKRAGGGSVAHAQVAV